MANGHARNIIEMELTSVRSDTALFEFLLFIARTFLPFHMSYPQAGRRYFIAKAKKRCSTLLVYVPALGATR